MLPRKKFQLRLPSRTLVLGERTLLMGVLNVTPDSFSGDGLNLDTEAAVSRALQMQRDGADILDIGGESTRPGAEWISAADELRRVLPVLQKLRGQLKIPISIDTNKSEVAEAAAEAGAEIINDVTALRRDPRIAEVARRRKLPLILMHMRGEPLTMQAAPFARNAMMEVTKGLKRAAALAVRAGVPKSQIVLDPGLGFGKSFEQNYDLIARLGELARLGFPLLIGPSRKGFIGRTLGGIPEGGRVFGTAAAVTACILQGAHIVRVHDVSEMAQVARVADAVRSGEAHRRRR
ncbi:MAG TPA: dihydropteroate synthase [Terriglobales bacterium]|jgi:dihydropteroate synthase|nr:dihydropteroate synthase [Terriglobales bacterium]